MSLYKRNLWFYRLFFRFYAKLEAVTSAKGKNSRYLSSEKYERIISEVKAAKEKGGKGREPHEYRLIARYDILYDKQDKLILPMTENNFQIKYFAKMSEIFSIVHEAHVNVGHGGRQKVCKEINNKYVNVPREAVSIYLELCQVCKQKKHNASSFFWNQQFHSLSQRLKGVQWLKPMKTNLRIHTFWKQVRRNLMKKDPNV